MHWSADDNNNVGISLDTNYLPVNFKTMGPSTNTPFVIFLAFTMNNGDTEDDFYDFNEFFELPSSMLSFCCHYNEQRRHRICLVMSISRIGWWIVHVTISIRDCDQSSVQLCECQCAISCMLLVVTVSPRPIHLATVHICIFTSLYPQHHHQHYVTLEWVALHTLIWCRTYLLHK